MKTQKRNEDHSTQLRLIVRALQDVVRRDSFEDYTDLSETLKERCARLKIRYNAALVSDAIDQLERGGKRPLVPLARRAVAAQPTEVRGLTKQEAADVLRAIFAR